MADLGYIDVLEIAIASGAFGGIAYVCTNISIKEKDILYLEKKAYCGPMLVITLTSVVAGAASAIGLLFALHFVSGFDFKNETGNILFFISAFLIAGIAAPVLIPKYATLINAKVLNAKIDAVEQTSAQSKAASEEATLFVKAAAALHADAPKEDKLAAAGLIKEHLAQTPLAQTNRTLVIYLGRLLRAAGDNLGAIAALEDFLKKKEAAGQRDKDYAAVMYNVACYSNLESANNKPELLQKALDCLKKSVEISPENKQIAVKDNDFELIRQNPRFIEITKS